MADLSKADEDRLRSVEKVATVAKAAGVIIVAVLALAIMGYTNLVATFGEFKGASALHAERIADAKSSQAEKIAEVKTQILDLKHSLSAQHAADFTRLEKLIEKVDARIIQRLGEPVLHKTSSYSTFSPSARYHEHIGKIAEVSKGLLSVELFEGETKLRYDFPVADGARIIVQGRTAVISDLKIGMTVVVLHANGHRLELIEQIEDVAPLPIQVMPPAGDKGK